MINFAASWIKALVRQPSLWIALGIWCLLSTAAILLCRDGVPLDRPELAAIPPITDVPANEQLGATTVAAARSSSNGASSAASVT